MFTQIYTLPEVLKFLVWCSGGNHVTETGSDSQMVVSPEYRMEGAKFSSHLVHTVYFMLSLFLMGWVIM